MSTEAMKLALEALGLYARTLAPTETQKKGMEAITALDEALAQPQQEPVAWAIFTNAGNARMWSTFQPHLQKLADAEGLTITPLYTSPPAQRTWVGLTDEEKLALLKKHFNAVCVPEWFDALLLDIEATHGITGEQK